MKNLLEDVSAKFIQIVFVAVWIVIMFTDNAGQAGCSRTHGEVKQMIDLIKKNITVTIRILHLSGIPKIKMFLVVE